jgi:bifunctional DNA primase/polymerase-like protein/AAA domain-containing protein/primase-like protein
MRPPTTSTTMLTAALEYVAHGVRVFPVWGVTDDGGCRCGGAECKNTGKHPLGRLAPNGFKDATTDEAQIREWWEQEPNANIGTPTETRVVLDVDPRHGGDKTLAALEGRYGALPVTALIFTGGGGRHYHFAMPADHAIPSSAGKLGAGLDIRGVGGYVLLPPSKHASGRNYHDDIDCALFEAPLAAVPEWMRLMLAGPASPNGGPATEATDWAALLAGAPEGERHAVATRIAGHYLGKGLAASEVEEILLGYCARCSPSPFPTDEARRIVRDLAEKHRRAAGRSAETAPGPVTPLGVGAGQFLAQSFPDSRPLVEGILSDDGGGWLGGEEKLGKSYYALEEAVCLALGLPVCGQFAVPDRQRVLLIEEEDPPRRTHRRLRALLRGHGYDPDGATVRAELDTWMRVSVWEGFTFDVPAMVARLDAALAEFRPAVCYVDVLRKVTLRDLNKAAEASALLALLDGLRRSYQVVFRIIHHYRKVQGFRAGRGSQEIGGSFVLGAWGENSLFFEPVGRKQGAVRVEAQSKDNPPQPAFRLRIDAEGPLWAPDCVRLVAEGEPDVAEADDLVFQALGSLPPIEALTGAPGVSIKAIVGAVKKSEKTVRRSLDRLLDSDRVLVTGTVTKQAKLYAVKS